MPNISELFEDAQLIKKIQERLPKLFQIAELESSRAGKIGMEVGTIREKILIALLIHVFGKDQINADLPITETQKDVLVNKIPLSIKTITGNGGIKAVWTVDAQKANEFLQKYEPSCDILLAQIFWGLSQGGLFLIPLEAQQEVFRILGRVRYLRLPKSGTNPRGVELDKGAVLKLLSHKQTLRIDINWKKDKIEYDSYKRWVDYWSE